MSPQHDFFDTPPVCDYCDRIAEYIGGEVGDGANTTVEYLCAEHAQMAPHERT